ncbi:MAG: cytochrome C biogenesis protein [Nanoarchaeota archaeon]|nr:cytochrome C biogenesis protein [Nanoarchaeota archaeon]
MAQTTLIVAFFAGILSFLSPCVLPLMPGFLAYLSGTTPTEATSHRKTLFLNSLFFVLGFGVIFSLLGVLLNTVLESVAYDAQIWLARIGGLIIIFFALFLLGIIKPTFLLQEKKLHVTKKFKSQYLTSFVFGAAFAVGWTPCVGVILGGVLALAITQPGLAFLLLLTYSLGLGIPFLVLGLFMDKALLLIKRSSTFFKYFNLFVGILMLILGFFVLFDKLYLLSSFG